MQTHDSSILSLFLKFEKNSPLAVSQDTVNKEDCVNNLQDIIVINEIR